MNESASERGKFEGGWGTRFWSTFINWELWWMNCTWCGRYADGFLIFIQGFWCSGWSEISRFQSYRSKILAWRVRLSWPWRASQRLKLPRCKAVNYASQTSGFSWGSSCYWKAAPTYGRFTYSFQSTRFRVRRKWSFTHWPVGQVCYRRFRSYSCETAGMYGIC